MIQDYLSEFVIKAYDVDNNTKFELLEIDPIDLINKNRLDIVAKLMYLEKIEKGLANADEFYLEHIRVMTKDSFIEAGSQKNNKQAFVDSFKNLVISLKENGYSIDSLPIPVDKNNKIIDGAHRVAASIYLKQKVKIIKLDIEGKYDVYDYNFFKEREMNNKYLDEIVLRYIELSKNIYCINVWPAAIGHEAELLELINDNVEIIYQKNITLNENGAFNYLSQIYKEYSWAQDDGDGFSGIYRKLTPCFPNFNPIKLYVVSANNADEILKLKEKIRDLYKLEKHSVHATDNMTETVQMTRLMLNDNCISFLNNAKPLTFKNTLKMIFDFKDYHDDTTIFDSSIVMALYGIRQAEDLDFITLENIIGNHNDYVKFYQKDKNELLFDQSNYFYYFDRKFVTLDNLRKFKVNRNSAKDVEDVKMIDTFVASIENGLTPIQELQINLIRYKRRTIAKIQGFIIKMSHKTGTYNLMRKVYKVIKGK